MIEAVNLTKRFDDIVAVDHISATIRDGSVFGLVVPTEPESPHF